MADPKLVELLKKGPAAWNRQRAKYLKPDLSGAILRAANLAEADLNRANLGRADLLWSHLGKANLTGADLSAANLIGADLSGANLSGANLGEARLIGANLSEANLHDADLINADLARVTLKGANLEQARLGWTHLGDVDLGAAVGLEGVRHWTPCSIGIDTLLKSGGRIPREFLRGCGVDPLIQDVLVGDPHARTEAFTQLLSTVHRPFQRCFISYATEDKAFADRLQQTLNKNGVDYWYAPEHGKWGERLDKQIGLEISLRDRMLLICSETSLQKDWVEFEIERAIEKEKQTGTQVTFPIMLDDALLKWTHPRATRIREVLAGDFRNATKGAAFDEAAKKLLDGLRL